MEDIDFFEYYDRIIQELKKDKRRDKNYFDNLDLVIQTILISNDFTELEKVERLRSIVYNNGSLNKKTLTDIEKELGYDRFYEENCR